MDLFLVDPLFQPLFRQLGLNNCTETIAFFTASEAAPFKNTLVKSHLVISGETSLPVFYKQYSFRNPSWRFLGRASKARCEFENYAVFQKLGIPCAQRIACGEQRDCLGRLQRAFIITQAVPNTSTLAEFVPVHCPNPASSTARRMRQSILEQLATTTKQVHAINFFRNDLFWRNILVAWTSGQDPKLWRIDCPRGKFVRSSIFRHRGRLYDLAALDLSAGKFATPREKIAFMKIYLGQPRLNAKAKQLIKDVLAYRKKRWKQA